jgi:uncharacterized RDD family membrane protein YckC
MTQPSYEPAPPAYQQGPPPGGPSGPRAGFWQRFAAALLDGLILFVPTVILSILLRHSPGLYYVLSTAISLGYYTYFEGGPTGQTLGKKALGIRVYDFRQGGPIGYGRGFLRQIVKYISAAVILLGYLWMLWDREKQTWHDKAAGSVVVPADAYR